MIEIVFSDSACGSLKAAQNYGRGSYIGGYTDVILTKHDGTKPTSEEIAQAQKEIQEQERLKWEQAIPMGGNPQDVFGFLLMLSIGDISSSNFAENRQKVIDSLWSIYPNEEGDSFINIVTQMQETLSEIRERVAKGEDVRIWYSSDPDDLCGLYWFMTELEPFESVLGKVFVVKLPEYECSEEGTVVVHDSWGEIDLGEWQKYTDFAEETTPAFRQLCVSQWNKLKQENASLRACINRKLLSVPETIYDSFIRQEIQKEQDEFQEAMVIGTVLGKYRLGIGDAWVAFRIENMVANGELEVISNAPKDMPSYHRKLKKIVK